MMGTLGMVSVCPVPGPRRRAAVSQLLTLQASVGPRRLLRKGVSVAQAEVGFNPPEPVSPGISCHSTPVTTMGRAGGRELGAGPRP